MSLEVVVHYRPGQGDEKSVQQIAEAAIQEFPIRRLPIFIPWCPTEGSRLPLKPKMQPPIISTKDVESIQKCFPASKPFNLHQSFDCTVFLLEFHPNLNRRKPLLRAQTIPLDANHAHLDNIPLNKKAILRRRWSVSVASVSCKDSVIPLSKELRYTLKRLNLHSFYRARWTIEEYVCNGQTLEDIWVTLNHIIKHKDLPQCNATIQRDIGQIWVFCDIINCEYVGLLLKERLNLVGAIHLVAHKYGVILRL
ncbi:shieldin complex subunit 3 [Ambystoma mexicanum]|uniref:shieldin complex subunit 3 n=1 Tax=Ambystoma mexicanum TaxID=8296 RepID=UPI0037E90B83